VTSLRLATRSSDLALAQSGTIAARIEAELGFEVELVTFKTRGDRLQDISLAKVGGKGLFVKELEEALLDGRADIAVHSAKDLPAQVPAGLEFIAFPERADPRDALVARNAGLTLATLRQGARVGTGSVRRVALLLAHRPDLEVVPLRGNVPTRIAKLDSENLDAVILACAGLDRLGLAHHIAERISPDVMLPAAGQGILAIEARAGDAEAGKVAQLGCDLATASAEAERAYLEALAGDCSVPLAAFAEPGVNGRLRFRALLTSLDGRRVLRTGADVPREEAAAAGAAAAAEILAAGGDALLAELQMQDDA